MKKTMHEEQKLSRWSMHPGLLFELFELKINANSIVTNGAESIQTRGSSYDFISIRKTVSRGPRDC